MVRSCYITTICNLYQLYKLPNPTWETQGFGASRSQVLLMPAAQRWIQKSLQCREVDLPQHLQAEHHVSPSGVPLCLAKKIKKVVTSVQQAMTRPQKYGWYVWEDDETRNECSNQRVHVAPGDAAQVPGPRIQVVGFQCWKWHRQGTGTASPLVAIMKQWFTND